VIVRPTIPILRCSAAGVPLGFCAEEVAEFQALGDDTPHLATLLGMPHDATSIPSPGEKRERKTLRLRAGQRAALVSVDGPLTLRAVGEADVLPVPRLFSKAAIAPIIGFTEEDGRVVLLLDVPGIIQMAGGSQVVVTETRTGA
jgi:hypothetical protein